MRCRFLDHHKISDASITPVKSDRVYVVHTHYHVDCSALSIGFTKSCRKLAFKKTTKNIVYRWWMNIIVIIVHQCCISAAHLLGSSTCGPASIFKTIASDNIRFIWLRKVRVWCTGKSLGLLPMSISGTLPTRFPI